VQTHSIYGLGLRVNVPIAGLAGLDAARSVDVCLNVGPLPAALANTPPHSSRDIYVSESADAEGRPSIHVSTLLDDAYYRLAYPDGTKVILDREGRTIWAEAPDSATLEDTAAYLLGPALGFALRLRGTTCLHASAVAIDGVAVAFVGSAGAGKSSLAAAFARHGCPVLTDDVAPLREIDDGFEVLPAYPRVRLWPDSVASLFGDSEALPRITPGWDKRYLGLTGAFGFQRTPLQLGAVYVLGEREAGASAPRIDALGPKQALIALVQDAYAAHLLDSALRAREFDVLARLVELVPIRRLVPNADFGRVGEIPALVTEDVAELRLARNRKGG
jgi:hypothetical protein